MYIESVPNRDSPPAILLRESYREGHRARLRTRRRRCVNDFGKAVRSNLSEAGCAFLRRGHVPVRQGANDADRLLLARDDRAALEQRLEAGDPLAGPVRQVEQRALPDLPAFAIALAQEDGGG